MRKATHRNNSKATALWLTASLCSLPFSAAEAADFGQAQHIYVPASLYERRIDLNQSSDSQIGPQPTPQTYRATTFKVNKPSSTNKTRPHPYGELPAPPVVSSSVKPSVVPPPPPYPASLSKVAHDFHAQVKQAAANPAVQAAYEQLKKQAEEYVRSGKLNEAKHAVAQALKLTPHDKTLIRELGAISLQRAHEFMQSANYEDAIQYARQSLAFDTNNKEAHILLNGLLTKQGIDAGDPAARIKNAELLAEQGRNDEAWVEYQAADRLKPSADAHVGMGNIALRLGERSRAASEYQLAAQIDPHSSAAHRQLALLKYQQGDVVGANSELTRALTLNPKDTDAAKALIELWQNQVSRVPGANSHLGLARAYQLAGNLQSAQAEYRTVVQIDPNNPHLPAARQSFKLAMARQEAEQASEAAHTLESQGAYAEALEKMDEAVRLNPVDSDLRVYQGYIFQKVGRFTDARQAYMTALKLNPHNLLAAARIKELPASSLPAVWTPDEAYPGSNAAAKAAAGQYPPYQPVQHENSLTNISNFAFALRNHMMTQQSQMNQGPDMSHDVMSSLTGGTPSESLATSATASSGVNPALSLTGNDPISGSVASTLAQARAAIARATGKPAAATNTFTSPTMPPQAPAITAPSSSGVSPDAFKGSSYLPASNAPAKTEDYNDAAALALPYSAAESTTMPGKTLVATSDSAPPLAPPVALPWHATPQDGAPPAVAPPFMPPAAGFSSAPALRGELPVAKAASDELPVAKATSLAGKVRLQLLNASPKLRGVDLNVALQNDSDNPLILPRTVHAIIRYNGKRPDTEVQAVFASSAVPAHGVAQGTVHVPYDKADPTADLVLPSLLPSTFADRDVHLVTSLAAAQRGL